jgi:hypothetical protein
MDHARRNGAFWIGLLLLACWARSAVAASTRWVTDPSPRARAGHGPLQACDTTAWSRVGGGVASIEYTLPKAGHVHVRVFDAAGREIAHPVDEWKPAGTHLTTFAFGPSATKQVFRYRVDCGRRSRSGRITVEP